MESRSTMAENIALEVKFQGETQIYSPSYRTSWEDLHAMLKCSFEVDEIAVFYLDDENEEVAIDSQEEYNLAKEISNTSENVLQMRVYPVNRDIGVTIPAAEAQPLPKMTVGACKRSHRESAPAADSPSNASSPSPATETVPIPPARPPVPPRLSRAQSLPGTAHKQGSVTGCVRQAVEELKQMNEGDIGESPELEKALIDRIVRGVLDGLDNNVQDKTRTRPSSWSPSEDARIPSTCSSSPQPDQTGTKTKTRSPGKGPMLEHSGITCDNCSSRIYGIRYKCGHCQDYDLCEECEALSGIHDPNHVFLKLKRPAFRVGMKSDGRVAPILKHPVYADDDTPVWEYKIKKLEEKIARKAARAELKRKYREEKRRVRLDCQGQVTPTKRERIERLAEKQAEQIMVAASQQVTPPFTPTVGVLAETTPLLVRKFDARFLRDGNLPDETHVQPKTKFVKSWIMKNTGNVQWNRDTKLKFLWGDINRLSADLIGIPPLTPGEEGPICVDFEAPVRPGSYQSHWRLTHKGEQFGHRVWCIIIVDKAEVLEPTCEKKKTVREEIVLAKVQENTESSENTPSNAVAHLQTGHSEEADLSRVVSSSDVLTAQDVFSFELLNIRDDQDREADKEVEGVNSPAATTTPNNTPIVGLTPCISPVPQLDEKLLCRRVSEHSDLEFVRREDIPEIVETPDSVTQNNPVSGNVKEGVEMGAVYSDIEDDVESIGSSSDSDILDDFYVVPLPDCFDPSKPIDKSMIMSKSSLASSMTSSAISTSPVVRLPSYEESEAEREMPSITIEEKKVVTTSDKNLITEKEEEDLNTETEESNTNLGDAEDSGLVELVAEGDVEGDVVSHESQDHTVDSLLGTLSNPALETTPLIPLIPASPVQQLNSSRQKPTSPTPQTVTMTPMPAITLLATPAEAPSTSDGGVLINPEGSVLYQTPGQQEVVRQPEPHVSDGTSVDLIESAMQHLDIADPGQGQERSQEHDDEFHDAQDTPQNAPQTAPEDAPPVDPQNTPEDTPPADIQNTPEDAPPTDPQNTFAGVHYQAQTDPVDLLGFTAARAVEVAGSVVRQAFDTAASSVGALLRPQPIPMTAPYQPPQPSESPAAPPSSVGPTPMEQLIEMGFANRARNQDLLNRHNDDVSRCVQELLQDEDNDWHNNRH